MSKDEIEKRKSFKKTKAKKNGPNLTQK